MKKYEKINIIWATLNIFSIFVVTIIFSTKVFNGVNIEGDFFFINAFSFAVFFCTAILIICYKNGSRFFKINMVLQSVGLLFTLGNMIYFEYISSALFKMIIYILNMTLGFVMNSRYQEIRSSSKSENYYLIAILCAVISSVAGYLMIYVQDYYFDIIL